MLRRRLQRSEDERGAVAVEFALVLPVLLLFLFGIIQFGAMFLIQHGLTEAAADAARTAAISPLASASTIATTQLGNNLSGDTGGLVSGSCASPGPGLTCTVSPAAFQCPNQPSGYNCLTVTVSYDTSKNGLFALLPYTPTIKESSTILLSGS